jgi:signal transduction histidine kinase/CheY-like chemotaxis protein
MKKKQQTLFSKYAQALFVLLTFSLMVISSYFFTSNAERRHLRTEAENAILFTEANIFNNMLEPETLLGVVTEMISSMLNNGADSYEINDYLSFINSYLVTSAEERMLGVTGFYGAFDSLGGVMLLGMYDWVQPENYDYTDRPWYTGAVKADGRTFMTHPYLNYYSNEITISLSRLVFDENRNVLGVVCLNIELNRIVQHVINTHFTEGGYGFLLSDDFLIIGHPNPSFVGFPFKDVNSGIVKYMDRLQEEGILSEIRTTDYRGVKVILFMQTLQNGWYMGVVTPIDNYFMSTRVLLRILALLGTVFASLLIWMLLRLTLERARLDEQMRLSTEQHARFLNTVNTAASILLTNNNIEVFEPSLMKCFELIGHCLDTDRVQIWRNEKNEDGNNLVLRYGWLSDHGKSCKEIPIGVHFPYSSRIEWENLFLHGGYINSPLSKLSKEDQDFLGYFEMKSVVILPMFLEGNFWGFFSIDDCRNERTFSEEEISILTSAGIMMINAINRNMQTIQLRESEERTQIMLDAAPLCIISWDKNLRLVDCNQEAVNMFGFSTKKEFIEKFVSLSPAYQSDGMTSGEKGFRLVGKAFEDGYSRFEWMHQKPDGEPVPVEVNCVRVKYKGEFRVTEYMRDLREQKAMIAEMRKTEVAEESSKAKSDFLAKMSHEIRTPMNAILGITEIQLQDYTHPQVTREAFERIYSSSGLLLGIINDILDLSKIEAGKLVLNPVQYDIASVINDSVQLVIMRFESKPIEFILNVNENLPLVFFGDELRIKQILNNILSNAFKYTDEGSINLTVYAEPSDSKDTRTIVFIITDTGQGMSDEQVKKLGSEYVRFNAEANRETEGTGLGMNITNNLIRLMNGDLFIESTPGMGSTFKVRLPQKCEGSSVIGKELADNLMRFSLDSTMKIKNMQTNRDFMPYGRVLIVDDVESNLYVARGLMAPYGLSIDTVISGFEALDKIRNGNTYDIIFMDHMMPKMDGIEATRMIRSMGYTKPVVVLTANALAGQAKMFLENGFDDFISKPIDIRHLNSVLNKLIRDKYPPEVIEAAQKQKESLFLGKINNKKIDPQLAEFFVRDAKKAITVLEAIYQNKCNRADDISTLIINIHGIKSALANIGETELSKEALKLEMAAREHNTKLIMSDIPSFFEKLNFVIERFKSKKETQDKTEDIYDNVFLKENLLVVKTACESFDKKTAKNTLSEIRKKSWTQSVNEKLADFAEYILHSDFDEAAKVIDDYVKQL